MEAGNTVAAEQFLSLSSCQHANRQSNHIATPKPIDNIYSETRGHSISSMADFLQIWLPTIFFISIRACHSFHSDMEHIFSLFVSGLGLFSFSPIKWSRSGILGLLSLGVKRTWTSALMWREPRHPVKKSLSFWRPKLWETILKMSPCAWQLRSNWQLAPRFQSCNDSTLDPPTPYQLLQTSYGEDMDPSPLSPAQIFDP